VSHATSLGDCPKCRESIPDYKLLIEYDADRGRERFAECPTCEDVVHPV
jgi:DNA-directed RNA polymerase subunit M/transcription elongation factor TFIIS